MQVRNGAKPSPILFRNMHSLGLVWISVLDCFLYNFGLEVIQSNIVGIGFSLHAPVSI